MKRISFILTALMLLSFGLANGQINQVTLDSVGPIIGNQIPLPAPSVKFTFRWEWHTAPGDGLGGYSIGYDLYSADGATWTSSAGAYHINFDPVRNDFGMSNTFQQNYSANGAVNDTVTFAGFDNSGQFGQLENFNDKSTVVTTGAIALGDTLKHLCLDSVTAYGVGGDWSFGGGITFGVYNPIYGPGGPFAANFTPGAGYCFQLFRPLNQNPVITGCNATVSGSHCAILMDTLSATDPENNTPFTWSVSAGVGSVSPTTGGSTVWSYQPTCADVGQNLSSTVRVTDALGGFSECTFNVVVTNVGPQITDGCGDSLEVGRGNPISHDLDDTPGDCDASTWSIGVVTPNPAPGTVTVNSSGNVTFNTSVTNSGVYTIPVIVTDCAGAADTCEIYVDVLTITPFSVVIEKTHLTFQGQHEYVDVTLTGGSQQMGGFDFLIAYDASALNFVGATPGPEFYNQSTDVPPGCGWEYFTYRYSAFGNCGNACPSGTVRVNGIAETNNGANHPDCYTPASLPAVMFTLDFLVTDDRTFECMYVPIRFLWLDCGDNTISDPTGDTLYISRSVYEYNTGLDIQTHDPNWVSYPTYQGAQDCDNDEPNKPDPIRLIDFYNGGIDIACADSIDDRGDINLNNIANEIADAVLFSRYFIYGLQVFDTNATRRAGQIAASDVNADGLALSVADLVYLIRIVIGDANPYPKALPVVEANYTNVNGEVAIDVPVGAAFIVAEGNVTPTLLASNMTMMTSFDGTNTRILVYQNVTVENTYIHTTAASFTGTFIANAGNVVSAEFATPQGGVVVAKGKVADRFTLNQNYPNPFNPKTKISFQLKEASAYTVTIYNITGQKVKEMSGVGARGTNEVEWDASNEASGIYFYKLNAGANSATKKMVFLK